MPFLSKFKVSIRNYSTFSIRHIGVDNKDIVKMLKVVKQDSLKDLVIKSTGIEHYTKIKLGSGISEHKPRPQRHFPIMRLLGGTSLRSNLQARS